jgi:hypothetical protein
MSAIAAPRQSGILRAAPRSRGRSSRLAGGPPPSPTSTSVRVVPSPPEVGIYLSGSWWRRALQGEAVSVLAPRIDEGAPGVSGD